MANNENDFGIDFDDPSPGQGGESSQGLGGGVGVVRVLNRDYAVGLHWSSVTQPSKSAEEARALAATSIGGDFFCVRGGNVPQFGLGFRSSSHKANMPSLAAHLVSSKGGSWLGLFTVPGGYYLIAVKDDGILSEMDRFIADAEHARDAFEDIQAHSNWNETIAPSSLDIPGTVEVQIERLLDGKPTVRLRDVKRSSTMAKAFLGVLVVGGLVVGSMMYLNELEQARLIEEARIQAENARSLIGGQPEQVVVPPMPWEGKPRGVAVLTACVEKAKAFRLDVPGWTLQQVLCDNASIAGTYNRAGTLGVTGGPVTWVSRFVPEGMDVVYPADGSTGTVVVTGSLGELAKIPADVQTMKVGDVQRGLLLVGESRMTEMRLGAADATEFWRGVTFQFKNDRDPQGFGDLLGALPGLMIDKVSFDVATSAWDLEGKVYEQLPLPQNAQPR